MNHRLLELDGTTELNDTDEGTEMGTSLSQVPELASSRIRLDSGLPAPELTASSPPTPCGLTACHSMKETSQSLPAAVANRIHFLCQLLINPSWFPEELFQKESGATSGFRGNEICKSFLMAALGTGGEVTSIVPRIWHP